MATKVLLDGHSIIDLEGVRDVEVRNNAVLVEPRHGTTINVALDSELVRRAFAGTVLTFPQGERLPQCVLSPNAKLSLVDYIRRQIREEEQEGDTPADLTRRLTVEVDTSEIDEALEKLERLQELREEVGGLLAPQGRSEGRRPRKRTIPDARELTEVDGVSAQNDNANPVTGGESGEVDLTIQRGSEVTGSIGDVDLRFQDIGPGRMRIVWEDDDGKHHIEVTRGAFEEQLGDVLGDKVTSLG